MRETKEIKEIQQYALNAIMTVVQCNPNKPGYEANCPFL